MKNIASDTMQFENKSIWLNIKMQLNNFILNILYFSKKKFIQHGFLTG